MPDEVQLLEFGASIGASIAFDGARRFRDLAIVDEGADVLWLTLRCARMNNLRTTKARLRELFAQARVCAKEGSSSPFHNAIRWLDFKEADALSVDGDPPPQMPHDLGAKVDDAKHRHELTSRS